MKELKRCLEEREVFERIEGGRNTNSADENQSKRGKINV